VVHIVIGKMNSGKTTRMKELYEKTHLGNGIVSKKYMIGSDVFGFNAYVLKDGTEFPYLLHEKQTQGFDEGVDFQGKIGPYLIYHAAEKRINSLYKHWIEEGVSPLYFDEVGKLELSHRGFSKQIQTALEAGIDVFLSVREDLVEKVLSHFAIKEYQIISG